MCLFYYAVSTFLVVIIALVSAIILISGIIVTVCLTAYYCVKRHKLFDKPVESSPHDMLEHVYENPDELNYDYHKSDPMTDENVAYDHSQQWTEI